MGAAAGVLSHFIRAFGYVTLAVALTLLAAPSLAGHSLDSGRSWVQLPIDLLHVLAVAFWLGSLTGLLALMRSGAPRDLLVDAARRFSRVAPLSVLVIAATGVVRALTELGSVGQLLTTGYGRAILVKSMLFAILIGLGWLSRGVVRKARGNFGQTVGAEVVVLGGLLIAVALLTALPPGRSPSAIAAPDPEPAPLGVAFLPAADATVVGHKDGSLAAAVAVRPSGATTATFIDTSGRAADVGSVTLDGNLAESCGVGCYRGRISKGRRFVVLRHGARMLRFDLGLRLPGQAIYARLNRTYKALRSTVYTQRIDTGLGTHIVAHWTEDAAKGFSYRIEGDSQAVVIGKRRWDRDQGKAWKFSITSPSGGIIPPWGTKGRITNAKILSRSPDSYVVAFLGANKSFPAWFSVTIDPKSFRIRRIRMTASAHFMRAHYLSWNAPVKLQPPPPHS
jgi:hypothetical protein